MSLPHLSSSGTVSGCTLPAFSGKRAAGSFTWCLRVGNNCALSSCVAMWELHLPSLRRQSGRAQGFQKESLPSMIVKFLLSPIVLHI